MKPCSNLQEILLGILLVLSVSGVAQAQSLKVTSPDYINAVIELYTSEGCSSCPPADRWLSNYQPALSADDGVIALAFHVDYWNYLGWEDAYSKPEYTARQRLLASINKQRTIYTPEFFVNAGETRRTGQIPSRVASTNSVSSTWDLALTSELHSTRHALNVQVEASSKTRAADAELYLALYENNIVREIGRGENRNKTLNHNFVVREWIGPIRFENTSKIEHTHTISFPADSKMHNTGVAAILAEPKTAKTLQAVKSDLKKLFSTENRLDVTIETTTE